MKSVKLPQLAWHNPKELELQFPDSWDIEVCNIAGYDRPALSDEQIRHAIANPIGMAPIREAAKGKKQVAIIFDDMARVTRVSKIVPHILAELALASIPNDHIRFICALGTHGALDRLDLVKKLGADVVAEYAVYNHNCFDNCVYVGTTSWGTKIYLNAEMMSCDFKISIGTATPHPSALFSGGGKMILPGVAGFNSIRDNHTLQISREQSLDYDDNPRRLEKKEAAKMAGLDMLVECIVNLWGKSCSIHAGTKNQAHEAAIREARTHYVAPMARDKDIVIANTYAKASEAGAAIRTSAQSVMSSGGDLVLIANAPQGQVPHYLLGRWGSKSVSKIKHTPDNPHINHIIRYSEYSEMIVADGKTNIMSDWSQVISFLKQFHGDGTKVAVYPSADIQYFGL
ncbi:MAG: DUF2088 domain-containing protein [Chloroflexi bacterium]|nr:DUF2088 domain-containing protein [Chloroflexota bacterium]